MADVVTFDPINLRIVEIAAGASNVLNIQEVYSEWKQWLLNDPARLAYPQAFRYVGADPISLTRSVGTVYFLLNGWRIRPAELNHTLTLEGDIYTDPFGSSPVVDTLGAFNARVEYSTSHLTELINAGATLTAGDIADAVWDEPAAGHLGAGSMGELQVAGAMPGLTSQQAAMLNEIYKLLGLDVAYVTEHGETYIRCPADGSVINIAVTRSGPVTTLQRL